VLAKLLKVYCQEMLLLDWYWYTKISEKLGEDETFKVSADNWCQIGDHEMRWTMEALNIKGNDVAAYAKTISLCHRSLRMYTSINGISRTTILVCSLSTNARR
jgi:hypothetical protein